jgi:hypothetical protein
VALTVFQLTWLVMGLRMVTAPPSRRAGGALTDLPFLDVGAGSMAAQPRGDDDEPDHGP